MCQRKKSPSENKTLSFIKTKFDNIILLHENHIYLQVENYNNTKKTKLNPYIHMTYSTSTTFLKILKYFKHIKKIRNT